MEKYFSWHDIRVIEVRESPEASTWTPLYRLICQQLKIDHRDCTNLGAQIAKSLINIAATRIFVKPSQSILELPVNSVDAYLVQSGQKGVGKFGMGFFSILYWLIDHPRRVLSIINRGKDNYICQLQERDGQLQYKLDVDDNSSSNISLTIILDCSDDPFTSIEIDDFNTQLQKLRFIDSASIDINNQHLNNPHLPKVNITLNEYRIVVQDNATGITLNVLKNSLLIPSSSTKTLQAETDVSSAVDDKTSIRIHNQQQYSTLSILVANIAVVDIKIDKNDISFVIDMQRTVGVPVSRDDILITSVEQIETFEYKMRRVAVLALDEGYINLYIKLLKMYAKQTTQQRIKDSIQNLHVYILDYALQHNYILYHASCSRTMKVLKQQYNINNFKFRSYDDYDVSTLEQQLQKLDIWRNDIYMAKLTCSVSTLHVVADNLNTSHYLVVNSSVPNWYSQLPLIFTEDRLIPVISQTNFTDNKIKELLTVLDLPAGDLYVDSYNFCLKVLSLNAYFEPEGEDDFYEVSEVFLKIFKYWLKMYDTQFINDLVQLMYVQLDRSRPTHYVYGQSQYTFRFIWAGPFHYDIIEGCLENINPLTHYDTSQPETFGDQISSFFEYNITYNANQFVEKMKWQIGDNIDDAQSSKLLEFNQDWLQSLIKFSSLWEDYGEFNYAQWGLLQISPLYLYLMTISQSDLIADWLRSNFDTLLSICDDVWQYYTIFEVLLIFQVSLSNNYQVRLSTIEYKQYATYLLDELRSRYTTPELKGWWLFVITNNDWTAAIINLIEPLLRLLYVFWNYQKETAIMPIFAIINYSVNHHYSFLASDCINYVFNHEVPQNNLEELYRVLSRSSVTNTTSFNLQTLEIAINEGTTKDPLQASITELVQNAVDALRQSHIAGTIRITISNTDNSLETALTISDPVGMNRDNILALFIPFLSTKTPSQLVTGQLGSGFFNVYRQAIKVIIDTTYDKIRTVIQDVPIKLNGRVVDLQRTVDLYEGHVNGTSITLILSSRNLEHKLQTITHIVNYVHSIITYTMVQGIEIKFNKHLLNPHVRRINIDNQVEYVAYEAIPETPSKYNKKRHVTQPFNSLVLTNGIPFISLKDYLVNTNLIPSFLINVIDQNILINLPSGSYQAVQSRTQIILTDANKTALQQFLYKVVYCHLLQRIVDNDAMANHWLANFKSEASIAQLWFDNSSAMPLAQCQSASQLVTNGDYLGNSESLALRINYLWGEAMSDPDTLLGQFAMGALLPTPDLLQQYVASTNLIPLAKQVLFLWLGFKNQDIVLDQQLQQIPISNVWTSEDIDRLNFFTQAWIRLYWYLGNQLNLPDTYFEGLAPTVQWSAFLDNQSTLGSYLRSTHHIELNLTAIKPSLLAAIDRFIRGEWESLPDDQQWNKMFGIQYPAATLVHEMEHAWRRSEHQAGHNDWQGLNFDSAANDVYRKIIEAGLYTELQAAL